MILRPHIVSYTASVGDSFILMYGNARPYIVRLVVNMSETEVIQCGVPILFGTKLDDVLNKPSASIE